MVPGFLTPTVRRACGFPDQMLKFHYLELRNKDRSKKTKTYYGKERGKIRL